MLASCNARMSGHAMAAVVAVVLIILLVWNATAAPSSVAGGGLLERQFADGRVSIALQRTADSAGELHVYFLDDAGQPRPISTPRISLSYANHAQSVELTNAGPGHVIGSLPQLPADGPYDVAVRAEIDETAYRAAGSVTVDPTDRSVAQRFVAWCSLQLARSRE